MMKLGREEILLMNALSNVSGVNARDCLIGNKIVSFVVKESEMGSAIGKNGATVNKLKKMLNKNIELVPYSKDPKKFLEESFNGIVFSEIGLRENNGKKLLLASVDSENRGKMMQNLGKMKRLKEIAKRNYEIDDIMVK